MNKTMDSKDAAEKIAGLADELLGSHPAASVVLNVLAGALVMEGGEAEEFAEIARQFAEMMIGRIDSKQRGMLN